MNSEPQTKPEPMDIDRDRSREEITLAEFPITTMALKRPKVTDWPVQEYLGRDENGKPIYRSWTIVGSEKYGLPIAGDEDIYVAIMKMVEHLDFGTTTIPCTRYQICQVLGSTPDGRLYQRIADAFTRFSTTKFVAENVFRDPGDGTLVAKEVFGIIDSVRFVDAKPKRRGKIVQQELPLSYFRVSDEFLRRLKEGNLKRLDTAFWRTLSSHLTKRLFRFLDKNRYRKTHYTIGLRKLGDKVGLAKSHAQRELKRLLKRPLDELATKGFIESYGFQKAQDGGWKVEIAFDANFGAYQRRNGQKAPEAHLEAKNAAESDLQRNSGSPGADGLRARELVVHFREAFHGTTRGRMARSDLARATELLQRCHGNLDRARFCIAWIRREADRTNFEIQSFGGLLANNYPDRALAAYEQEERRLAQEEERHRHEERRSRYHEWWTKQVDRAWDDLPQDEQERRIAEAEATLRAKEGERIRAWPKQVLESTSRSSARGRFAKEIDVPSFEEWLQRKPGETTSSEKAASSAENLPPTN